MDLVEIDPAIQHFARYEFKYLLPPDIRQQIEEEISQFMYIDGHVDPSLDQVYFVRSLYFETPTRKNYYEKIDGVKTRKKYRLRTYSKTLPAPIIFLEEKGRYNQRTYKNRVQVEWEHVPIILDPSQHQQLLELFPSVRLIESFIFDSARQVLSPTVLVDYCRRPYTSSYDTNFRATFDSSLTATSTGLLFPSSGSFEIESGSTVLEIKFHRRIPAWFHRLLQAYNLNRLSISKFCKGMEVCGLAKNLE
jgi:hypothetical protein